MPIGPRGEKRPADANACAVAVARIATEEVEEVIQIKDGRIKSGKAGGAARAKKMSPQRRREVAQKAACARWQNEEGTYSVESDMSTKTTKEGVARPQDDCVVLMYPSNQLGQQVREFKDTLRMSQVIQREFFDKK